MKKHRTLIIIVVVVAAVGVGLYIANKNATILPSL